MTSHPYDGRPYITTTSSFFAFTVVVVTMTSAVLQATTCPTATCPQDSAAPPKDTEHGEAKLATGDLLPLCNTPRPHIFRGTVTNGDAAPEGRPNENLSPMGEPEPEEKPMPPNLEAFISGEYLPDHINVYVTSFSHKISLPHLDSGLWERFITQHPVRFVRKYPPLARSSAKGTFETKVIACSNVWMRIIGNGSNPVVPGSPDRPTTGQLDLRHFEFLGSGHHSFVILAPLTLPSIVSAPSVHGAVAVKLANGRASEREMLENEAKIYNAFPRELQEGSSYAPPIVPKFYGYYVPSLKVVDGHPNDDKFTQEEREYIRMMLERITPILLVESCGEDICAKDLSSTNRWAHVFTSA